MRAAHCFRIIGIDLSAAQVRSGIGGDISQLRSEIVRRLVRRGDALTQQLRNVDVGKRRDQRGHHKSDGQDDLGSSPHCELLNENQADL